MSFKVWHLILIATLIQAVALKLCTSRGEKACLKFPGYTDYQWAVCLYGRYINKSDPDSGCKDQNCWYGCERELNNKNQGNVTRGCQCNPNSTEATTPTDKSPNSPNSWCHIQAYYQPGWFWKCMKTCVDQPAIQYAHNLTGRWYFKGQTKEWIYSMGKCFGRVVIPFIRNYTNKTISCETINRAVEMIKPCCLAGRPACTPAGSTSICNIPLTETWGRTVRALSNQMKTMKLFKDVIHVINASCSQQSLFNASYIFKTGSITLRKDMRVFKDSRVSPADEWRDRYDYRRFKEVGAQLSKWIENRLRCQKINWRRCGFKVDWRWIDTFTVMNREKSNPGEYLLIEYAFSDSRYIDFGWKRPDFLPARIEEMESFLRGDQVDFNTVVNGTQYSVDSAKICDTVLCEKPTFIKVKPYVSAGVSLQTCTSSITTLLMFLFLF